MNNTSQAQASMPQSSYSTPLLFYERYACVRLAPIGGRLALSLILGVLFLLASIRHDFQQTISQPYWMLGLMIICSMILLQLATMRLWVMISQLINRHPDRAQPEFDANRCKFVRYIQTSLSDWRMISAGVIFGALNVICGALFGTKDFNPKPELYAGFFLVGFICGMAAYGIFVVIRCVKQYVQEIEIQFDDSHPDGCGGMGIIGSSIGFFAIVTLIMGVLIAVYLLHTDWHNRQENSFVQLALLSWAVFPFLMSAWVLIAPMSELHSEALNYKEKRESELKCSLDKLRKKLGTIDDLNSEAKKAIVDQIEYTQSLRQRVHNMRAWPYSLEVRMNYTLTLIPSIAAAVSSANEVVNIFEWY